MVLLSNGLMKLKDLKVSLNGTFCLKFGGFLGKHDPYGAARCKQMVVEQSQTKCYDTEKLTLLKDKPQKIPFDQIQPFHHLPFVQRTSDFDN